MPSCPSCGSDVPAGARFCPACGAALTQSPATEDMLSSSRWSSPTSSARPLVGILTLVGILVYAFRGVYPHEIFRFVIGMARWSFRVGTYVALMRDEYPPFRLEP